FEDKDLPRSANSTSSQTSTGAGAPFTSSNNTAFTTTDRVSGIALHALRLGLTHYFGGGEPVVGAYAMATKAPPLVAAPWEGAYGGVADGPASVPGARPTLSPE